MDCTKAMNHDHNRIEITFDKQWSYIQGLQDMVLKNRKDVNEIVFSYCALFEFEKYNFVIQEKKE